MHIAPKARAVMPATLLLDEGGLVAADKPADVTTIPGLSNKMFGGNGFFLATLTGPGKVWLQSMSITQLAVEIADHLPSGSTSSSSTTGSFLGGLLNS